MTARKVLACRTCCDRIASSSLPPGPADFLSVWPRPNLRPLQTMSQPPKPSKASKPKAEPLAPQPESKKLPDPAAEVARLCGQLTRLLHSSNLPLKTEEEFSGLDPDDLALEFSVRIVGHGGKVMGAVRGSANFSEILSAELLPVAFRQLNEGMQLQIIKPLGVKLQRAIEARANAIAASQRRPNPDDIPDEFEDESDVLPPVLPAPDSGGDDADHYHGRDPAAPFDSDPAVDQ